MTPSGLNTPANRRAAAFQAITEVVRNAGGNPGCIVERDNAFCYSCSPTRPGDVAQVGWVP